MIFDYFYYPVMSEVGMLILSLTLTTPLEIKDKLGLRNCL